MKSLSQFIKWYNSPTYGWVGRRCRQLPGWHPGWRWEHLIIAFLLGILLGGRGPARILHTDVVGAGLKLQSIKPLPLYKTAALEGQESLQLVFVNHLRPYGSYANSYAWGNCTAYVASRLPIPNNWGNANNWSYAAAMAGYSLSHAPEAGTIAQTAGDSSMGHVAVVETVYPDGSFQVSEMNYAGLDVIDYRTTSTTEFPNFIKI